MNKDLIETPRFNFFIGDEVLLKGKIVGFDVDENKCVENVVRLEYGQTLNVPNCNIYTKNNIIDEPQKIQIPQFVADWYENNKDYLEYNFQDWLKHLSDYRLSKNEQFGKWVNEPENNPAETLIKMKLFGYEVEKEKRYLVKVKGVNEYGCYLNKGSLSKEYFLESKAEIGGCRTKHTRKQLEEDGFGWVFDCPGIEIEEVEE